MVNLLDMGHCLHNLDLSLVSEGLSSSHNFVVELSTCMILDGAISGRFGTILLHVSRERRREVLRNCDCERERVLACRSAPSRELVNLVRQISYDFLLLKEDFIAILLVFEPC